MFVDKIVIIFHLVIHTYFEIDSDPIAKKVCYPWSRRYSRYLDESSAMALNAFLINTVIINWIYNSICETLQNMTKRGSNNLLYSGECWHFKRSFDDDQRSMMKNGVCRNRYIEKWSVIHSYNKYSTYPQAPKDTREVSIIFYESKENAGLRNSMYLLIKINFLNL